MAARCSQGPCVCRIRWFAALRYRRQRCKGPPPPAPMPARRKRLGPSY
jgi:hypothetical protein